MRSDLLPESVNLFLDDFETSLCLPILLIMVLCTLQFIFNRVFDVGYIIYQSMRKLTTAEEGQGRQTTDIIGKLKGMLKIFGIGKNDATNMTSIKNPSSSIDGRSREEEWDYCDEDIE